MQSIDMENKERKYNDAPIEGKDWLIQNLIKLTEAEVGVPVTLTTTGGAVSGILISGQRYMESLEASLRAAKSGAPDTLGDWVKGLSPVTAEWDEDGPYFVHLEDARIEIGKEMMHTNGVWRGNLAHVTGFILGAAK